MFLDSDKRVQENPVRTPGLQTKNKETDRACLWFRGDILRSFLRPFQSPAVGNARALPPPGGARRGGLRQVGRDQVPGSPAPSRNLRSPALRPDPHPGGPGYLRAAPETADCLPGAPKG